MTTYSLVAIDHDVSTGRLLSPESKSLFKAIIEPSLTSNSLVLCEGCNTEGEFLTENHPAYVRYSEVLLGLSGSARPKLGGYDFRQKGSTEENKERLIHRGEAWYDTLKSVLDFDLSLRPKKLSEVVGILKGTPPPVSLKRMPTPEEVALARSVNAPNLKLDRLYLEAMRKHGRRSDVCVYVGGAVHAVAMHLKTGYPLVDFLGSSLARDTLYGYLAQYKWSRLIVDAKP